MKEETMVLNQPMSLEEYIAFEEKSEVRHEMVDQQLFAMPGTTDFHNLICQNLAFQLRLFLKGRSCRVFMESLKVQIVEYSTYLYPDILVACDQRDLESRYIKRHPMVIFEVISKSSRTYDSADKFILYKQVDSLQNYILVDSEKMLVEVRQKLENGEWESENYLPANGKFPIPALQVELTFADVYEDVVFA